MAHRVKIEQIPYVKGDGTVSDKKRRYRVTCKHRGKVCMDPVEFNTRSDAETCKTNHHASKKGSEGKSLPTPKRPPTMHPRRRAERVANRHEMDRQNAALAELREM